MSKYDITDIRTVSFVEAIRLRPWMYLGDPRNYLGVPKNPLSTIVGIFSDSFLDLGVSEFTICETQNFFIIETKQDWLNNKNNRDVEYYFRESTTGPPRAEPLLPAFYYPFYTKGDIGELGKKEVFEKFCAHERLDISDVYGRILIISKQQRLPKNHGIVFERPQQSIEDLENDKKWLEVAIQSAKSNR